MTDDKQNQANLENQHEQYEEPQNKRMKIEIKPKEKSLNLDINEELQNKKIEPKQKSFSSDNNEEPPNKRMIIEPKEKCISSVINEEPQNKRIKIEPKEKSFSSDNNEVGSSLYCDEEDRDSLSKLTEKEREMALFKRREGLEKYKQIKSIEKMKKNEITQLSREKKETEINVQIPSIEDELEREFKLIERSSINENFVENIKIEDFKKLIISRNIIIRIIQKQTIEDIIGGHILYSTDSGYQVGKIVGFTECKEYTCHSLFGAMTVKKLINVQTFNTTIIFSLDIVSNKTPEIKELEQYKKELLEYLNKSIENTYDFNEHVLIAERIKTLKVKNTNVNEKITKTAPAGGIKTSNTLKQANKPVSLEQKKRIPTYMEKKIIVKQKIALRTKINNAELRKDFAAVKLLEEQYEALMTPDDRFTCWAPVGTNRPRLVCNLSEEEFQKQLDKKSKNK
ncbi:hypothetical protein CDIK_0022 [Cucumispora dikerogammari]|nr:hypothetical protein CDIK_0022 [Cucumispora dikerogammari]